nr:hypothetical protein [Haliscomenobacter sp.]
MAYQGAINDCNPNKYNTRPDYFYFLFRKSGSSVDLVLLLPSSTKPMVNVTKHGVILRKTELGFENEGVLNPAPFAKEILYTSFTVP